MAKSVLSGPVALAGAEAFQYVRRRLAEAFPAVDWRLGAADGLPRLTISSPPGLAEGAFKLTPRLSDGAPQLDIAGGATSGVVYAVDELIWTATASGGKLVLPLQPISSSPGLAYRTFWTWDHSTNWELSQIGVQEIGVFNPYSKPPRGFLDDYKRCVDFCSRNRIAAIVIFGFLRDTHGGIDAGKELCRYANERGVRILPGIAIGSYGGVYWEGDHEFNLATWLKKHPQHAATMEKGVGFQLADLAFPLNFPRSDYTMTACPSAPETMEWMERATSWLAETFEIGGINIESGDYGVCGCDRCRARRANAAETARRQSDHGDSWSHTDMSTNFPRLYAAAKKHRPDGWIYAEMQWDNLLDPVAFEAQQRLPRGGIYQHTMNRTFWNRLQKELKGDYVKSLPTFPNVLRCQFACQWNGDERTERYALNARTFAEQARFASQIGMQGLTVWGEPSPYHATVELSYLAFARFSYQPDLTFERFLQEDAAPLLGGVDEARRFVDIAEELDAHQRLPASRLGDLQKDALKRAVGIAGEAGRRWLTLADQIGRRGFMGG